MLNKSLSTLLYGFAAIGGACILTKAGIEINKLRSKPDNDAKNRDSLSQKIAQKIKLETINNLKKQTKQKLKILRNSINPSDYLRGVDWRKFFPVWKLRIIDPYEGLTQIRTKFTIKEINKKLNKKGFEFPIDSLDSMTCKELINYNDYGFSALKYGPMENWIRELSMKIPSKGKYVLTTKGVPNYYRGNIAR